MPSLAHVRATLAALKTSQARVIMRQVSDETSKYSSRDFRNARLVDLANFVASYVEEAATGREAADANMCNLYHHKTSKAVLQDLSTQMDLPLFETGNLQPGYVGRDQDGPVLRCSRDGLKLDTMRWGFPPDQDFSLTKRTKTGRPVRNPPRTNIRKVTYRMSTWPEWILPAEQRCLVPFSRFAEPIAGRGRDNAWFRVTGERQGYFAGIWRPWSGDNRLVPIEGKAKRERVPADLNLYAFLTTEPNSIVAPIHPKAMPVILVEPSDCAEWLAGGKDSLRLQRPLPDDDLELLPDTA